MDEPRKVRVAVTYSIAKIEKEIRECLEDFTYNDIASGETDNISLTLNNSSLRFMDTYMPKKSDRINPNIYFYNWRKSGVKN